MWNWELTFLFLLRGGITPGNARGLVLPLYSGTTLSSAWGLAGILGVEPGLATGTVNTLPNVLLLQHLELTFLNVLLIFSFVIHFEGTYLEAK